MERLGSAPLRFICPRSLICSRSLSFSMQRCSQDNAVVFDSPASGLLSLYWHCCRSAGRPRAQDRSSGSFSRLRRGMSCSDWPTPSSPAETLTMALCRNSSFSKRCVSFHFFAALVCRRHARFQLWFAKGCHGTTRLQHMFSLVGCFDNSSGVHPTTEQEGVAVMRAI